MLEYVVLFQLTKHLVFFFVLDTNSITSIPSEVGMLGSLQELYLREWLSTRRTLFLLCFLWLSISMFPIEKNKITNNGFLQNDFSLSLS